MISPKQRLRWLSANTLLPLMIALAFGLASIIIYALQFSSPQVFSVIATGILVAGASFVIGGFLGFLFGIPRTLQSDRPLVSPTHINGASQEASDHSNTSLEYRANTNLEQISDWLTKILVGVGLTQIGHLPAALQTLGSSLAPGLGNAKDSPSFAVVILLYFLVGGFLPGYLLTRLLLPGAFRQADLAAGHQGSRDQPAGSSHQYSDQRAIRSTNAKRRPRFEPRQPRPGPKPANACCPARGTQ